MSPAEILSASCLHASSQGLEKQAIIGGLGTLARTVPSLWKGMRAARGIYSAGKAAVPSASRALLQSAPPMTAGNRFRLAADTFGKSFLRGMTPGGTRQMVARHLPQQGLTGAPGRWLNQWGQSAANAHRANFAGWNGAGTWGRTRMLTRPYTKSLWNGMALYGGQQAYANRDRAGEMQEQYNAGLGEGVAYMKANPMKALGMQFATPEYVGAQLEELTGPYGSRTREAFDEGLEAYKTLTPEELTRRNTLNFAQRHAQGIF